MFRLFWQMVDESASKLWLGQEQSSKWEHHAHPALAVHSMWLRLVSKVGQRRCTAVLKMSRSRVEPWNQEYNFSWHMRNWLLAACLVWACVYAGAHTSAHTTHAWMYTNAHMHTHTMFCAHACRPSCEPPSTSLRKRDWLSRSSSGQEQRCAHPYWMLTLGNGGALDSKESSTWFKGKQHLIQRKPALDSKETQGWRMQGR